MKRFFIVIFLCITVFSLYANVPTKENGVVISIAELKRQPEDHIRVYNKTACAEFKFALYGWVESINEWIPINSNQQKEMKQTPDSCLIDMGSMGLERINFKYVAVGVDIGKISKMSVHVRFDDLIIDIEEIDTDSEKKDDCEMFFDYEIKEIGELKNFNKSELFDGIMAACVDIFTKSDYVIEYSDKDAGIIKGKTNNYTFRFDIKDERYRITVDLYKPSNDIDSFLSFGFVSYPYYKCLFGQEMKLLIAKNTMDADW